MNTNAALKAALFLSLSTLAACALGDTDLEGGEELEVELAQTESASTTCATPAVTAAAITAQEWM